MASHLASGVIVAAVQPFTESGAIDWDTTARYITQVAQAQPQAIAMNMAVSEVSSPRDRRAAGGNTPLPGDTRRKLPRCSPG